MTTLDLSLAASVDASRSEAPPLTFLRVSGADAISFLDSQLTRNVPTAGTAALAGYCSPKGRLLACFVVWRMTGGDAGDTVGLLVAGAIVEAIAKRLRLYVMRAKVVIELAVDRVAEGHFAAPDAATLPVWGVATHPDCTWIRYPAAPEGMRFVRIGPRVAGSATRIDDATWRWLDIRAGLPSIGVATQDRFVPQMVNLEALGGVDFRKGCFPGQEVVARSQYLGKLKRRMALATIDGDDVPEAGTDVWSTSSGDPVGLVVAAALGPDGRGAALIELPVALFEATDLRIGGQAGTALALEPLPYELPDNEVFVRPKL